MLIHADHFGGTGGDAGAASDTSPYACNGHGIILVKISTLEAPV